MIKGINSIGVFLKIAIAILGIVFCAFIIGGADTTLSISDQIANYGWQLDGAFYLTYIATGISFFVIMIFAIIHIVRNPKTLIGVAAFLALLLISFYGLSDNEVIPDFYPENTTPFVSQIVGAGLIALYIIGAASIAVIIYVEINKLLK